MLCCAIKPLCAWNIERCGTVCRERCGGQGYLSCNRCGGCGVGWRWRRLEGGQGGDWVGR